MHEKVLGLTVLVGALLLAGGSVHAAGDAQGIRTAATFMNGQWSTVPSEVTVQKAKPKKRMADHRPT